MREEIGVAQLLDKTGEPASKTGFALRNIQPFRLGG
jgi:hypothetical protein